MKRERKAVEARMARNWRSVIGIVALLAIAGGVAGAAPRAARARRRATPKARPQSEAILGEVADRLWDRGDFYWHEGRYEERVAVDRLVIRMQPRFVEPYGTAGWLLESLGRPSEALAMYRQGVTAVPDRWETHQDLGMFYYEHKQYAEAAAAFRDASRQQDPPPYVWKMLAHALERAGELKEAVAAWETAGRLAPEDGAVPLNLSRVRAKLEAAGKE
jgi:tetratricopeptide (TPR) repeat protein